MSEGFVEPVCIASPVHGCGWLRQRKGDFAPASADNLLPLRQCCEHQKLLSSLAAAMTEIASQYFAVEIAKALEL